MPDFRFGPLSLPAPDPQPVRMMRGQHTPCSPEELMATFMTALREAGSNEITVTAGSDPEWPGVEFAWQETR